MVTPKSFCYNTAKPRKGRLLFGIFILDCCIGFGGLGSLGVCGEIFLLFFNDVFYKASGVGC